MSIEKIFQQTFVTALKSVEPHHLLEGSGGFLNVYDIKCNKLLETIDLFNGSRIHAIRTSENGVILVYGGKKAAILSLQLDNTNNRIKLEIIFEEADWIQDAKLMQSKKFLVSLSSHNQICIRETASGAVIHRSQCEEQCILYSGKILGNSLSDLIVLSGTVFGEILVWSVDGDNSHILHRLTGHKGVIFSVNYDVITSTIISTSDDRSVRTWTVKHRTEGEPWKSRCGGNLTDLISTARIEAQHQLFGHEARVWDSLIFRRRGHEGLTYLVSLGEDSHLCFWDLATGKLLNQLEGHQGASVWAADWVAPLDALVTGGGDGSIRLWSADSHITEPGSQRLVLPCDADVPRLLGSTGGSHWTLTLRGTIYRLEDGAWDPAYHDPRLGNGCVMDCDPEAASMVIGTLSGAVFFFSFHQGGIQLVSVAQVDASKIFSVHLVRSHRCLVSLSEGRMQLRPAGTAGEGTISHFVLPPAKQRWPTCALTVDAGVLVGDRDGSLHAYHYNEEAPLRSWLHVHGRKGVTDIQADPSDDCSVYTCGRDGQVRLWRLGSLLDLQLLRTINTGLGWIGRLLWIAGQITYLAFRGDQFVVWSAHQMRPLMSVSCGGGHRSWHLAVDQSDQHAAFFFIKDKNVFVNRRPVESLLDTSVKIGGHSKTTCVAKMIRRSDGNSVAATVLTGSEDTTLRISHLTYRSVLAPFRCLSIIPKHVSSIRAMALMQMEASDLAFEDDTTGQQRWLCASAGGRAQLCVAVVGCSQSEPASVTYSDVRSHFLRGMVHRHAGVANDTETRYMDLTVVRWTSSPSRFHVVAACSDGVVRIFDCCLASRRLEVSRQLDFHRCCVLKVSTTRHPVSGARILLSAATDGRVALWDLDRLVRADQIKDQPVNHWKLHQSGVNSLDWFWTDETSGYQLLLLTGGDDNALTLSRVAVDAALTHARIADQHCQVDAHAGQISGASFVAGGRLAVSVSLDQRLMLWRVRNADLERLSGVCCDVPDIQGLDVDATDPSQSLVCVYGQGLQLMRIHHNP